MRGEERAGKTRVYVQRINPLSPDRANDRLERGDELKLTQQKTAREPRDRGGERCQISANERVAKKQTAARVRRSGGGGDAGHARVCHWTAEISGGDGHVPHAGPLICPSARLARASLLPAAGDIGGPSLAFRLSASRPSPPVFRDGQGGVEPLGDGPWRARWLSACLHTPYPEPINHPRGKRAPSARNVDQVPALNLNVQVFADACEALHERTHGRHQQLLPRLQVMSKAQYCPSRSRVLHPFVGTFTTLKTEKES